MLILKEIIIIIIIIIIIKIDGSSCKLSITTFIYREEMEDN